MAAFKGIRIRVRRVNDNAIMFDSGGPIANCAEMMLDLGAFNGPVQYVLEGQTVDGEATTTNIPEPLIRRQVMVALALHK